MCSKDEAVSIKIVCVGGVDGLPFLRKYTEGARKKGGGAPCCIQCYSKGYKTTEVSVHRDAVDITSTY